jgi:HD-GYP domain-containing protein (c-di-GMP phosphodiesterase class II)
VKGNRDDETVYCSHCGKTVEDRRYIRKGGNIFCCESCYFRDTYLDGIVDQMEASYLATLEAFVAAIDAREHEVGNHSLRVTEYAIVIGRKYGISGRDLVDLYCGALLHDLGKIGIPDAILHKKSGLTGEELEVMRRHPEIGYGIVGHIGYLSRAAAIVRSHHEHYDGSGYPRGLKGGEIPAGARVFAVADALDALTVKRPYRKAVSFGEAERIILAGSGALFDPEVIEVFVEVSGELREFLGRVML